jgi:hypothetical protein
MDVFKPLAFLVRPSRLGAATIVAHLLGTSAVLAAPPQPAPVAIQGWPAPPFQAWAGVETMWIRAEPRMASHLAGLLHRGDVVTVTGCVPDCQSPKAWALLGTDGAVPLKPLKLLPLPPDAARTSNQARYIYGRVPHPKTPVFAAPLAKARKLRTEQAEFRLAFVSDPVLLAKGWLQRPDGGWMRAKDIVLFTPSTFSGAHDPLGPVVFVRHKVKLHSLDRKLDKTAVAVVYPRYTVLALQGEKPGRVLVPGGWLPRNRVRIARVFARPHEVKPGDRWLHVDLTEQVLTAYDGDRPVFATLVSTGKTDRKATQTHEGTFRIYARSVHSSMRGKPWDDYYAEEVPFTMHFDQGRALHGAYWHDQFGIEKSHGCINLSLADAEWLFQWLPPKLPSGWSAILPQAGKQPMVAVVVEKKGKPAPSSLTLARPLPGAVVAK